MGLSDGATGYSADWAAVAFPNGFAGVEVEAAGLGTVGAAGISEIHSRPAFASEVRLGRAGDLVATTSVARLDPIGPIDSNRVFSLVAERVW